MQKNSLSQIVREEILRACIFAGALFLILISTFSITVSAANGGLFGDLLNKILVKTWDDTSNDGTVKNAAKLNGKSDTEFIKVPSGGFNCQPNQCIKGIDTNGNFECQ